MPTWIALDSQDAIDSFLMQFSGFHDSCLRQVVVSGETFVAKNLRMSCPGHLETSVVLFMQSQNERLPAVEIKCERVTGIRITPSADGCDSIITSGTIAKENEIYRIALNFFGAPLRGEPNSTITIYEPDQPDIEVTSQVIWWRPVPDGLGEALRYHPVQSI